MATTPKVQKEKSYTASHPRLIPRPTAASAARARIAINRNGLPPAQAAPTVQKPPNNAALPATQPPYKVKCSPQRTISRLDSKTDVNTKHEHDAFVVENLTVNVVETSRDRNIKFTGAVTSEGGHYEHISRSQPHTPVISSRPQTPRSLHSSRPQTPALPIHSENAVRPPHGTPVSRPETPQPQNALSITSTPVKIKTESHLPISISPPQSPTREEDVQQIYSLKLKQFRKMKMDLDLKQQAVLEAFNCLRGLRDRMDQEGLGSGEGVQQQELVVFNVADWAAEEVSRLCHDAAAAAAATGASQLLGNIASLDKHTLDEVDAKVSEFPERFADLCLQAFTGRQEIIDWIKEVFEKEGDDMVEYVERIGTYNEQGLELCDALRDLKNSAVAAVNSIMQLSRQMYQEKNVLVSMGECLVREVAHLKQQIMECPQKQIDLVNLLEETRLELEEERGARMATKDKISVTDTQLRQARARISKMDRQLREAEASIASLTGTVKTLEDQSRQKEVQLEARARKLKESLKTSEVASSQIAQQRDILQTQVTDLKEQIESITAQHKSAIQDLTSQLKEMKRSVEEQKVLTQQEEEQKKTLYATVKENEQTIEELRSKVTELENSRPKSDVPTEREIDLWAELQATKETLRMAEEEMTACKREKIRFLETMSKITDTDNKVAMQQKLAAELLSKEEIISKMHMQIRELTKNIKLNEHKVIQYEQYVQNLQAHNRALGNGEDTQSGINYQDLQQEIMNLKMSLLEAVHRNDDLTEVLAQKEQQLEQQDKTSRAQARVIKVREELINMLKNKETEQSRELAALKQDLEHRMNVVGEVNKQIAAKADEIQELFVTLENKQQQIHRLEKIVHALEEQQRRAQAQRTRHEEKIAALEHELAESGSRRERKYLLF